MTQLYYHPNYALMYDKWQKYRLTYNGGEDFVDEYLQQYSARETAAEFTARKTFSYCPAHAKAAINDVRNAIYARMVDITRYGGSVSYHSAVVGENNGVDNQKRTMDDFIGGLILPELLTMGKVGVYVDRMSSGIISKLDNMTIRPYLYHYTAENILSWSYDHDGNLTAILLKDTVIDYDQVFGVAKGYIKRYRLLRKDVDPATGNPIVTVNIFDDNNDLDINTPYAILNLTEIPFVIFELESSLLTDVADYQIALLNIESSDVNYIIKSNFPFYVEQRSEIDGLKTALKGGSVESTDLGTRQGRTYPKGSDQPAFIHPSPEPLLASIEKQSQIKNDIRSLISLAVSNLASSSAESKEYNDRGLEAGLAVIGAELSYGENKIAQIWADYENQSPAVIKYPRTYNLKSDKDRMDEADELIEKISKLPSKTYQISLAKEVARLMIGHKVSDKILQQIYKEIEQSPVILTDPEIIRSDFEAGFVSTALSSALRGYPDGEVEEAKKDHVERLARIAAAQSPNNDLGAARGLPDFEDQSQTSGKEEKKESRQTDKEETTEDKTRGEQKLPLKDEQ